MGVKMRSSEVRQKEDRVSHIIFADNSYLFAEPKEQIWKMICDAAEELRKKGLNCEEDQMKMISWWFSDKVWDLFVDVGDKGPRFEWFRANHISKARQRFVERGEVNIKRFVLQRIWGYKEKIFGKKRNKQTDPMMRNILTLVYKEWKE